jgi:large repetitive protein
VTAGVSKTIHALDGDDITTTGSSVADYLYAGNGTQWLYGNAGSDLLVGAVGDQFLYGGSGNDYIVAGNGNQTLDGGSGIDTVDFSRLAGRLVIDQDLHTATLYDVATGALMYTYTVTSFNSVIGTDYGTELHGQANTANTYTFGAGNDHYYSENGGDLVSSGAGNDVFTWYRKYAPVGHADSITDFEIGADRLDLADYLKGQGIKNATYDQVVHVQDVVDASGVHGALVQGLVNGAWYDIVTLRGIDIADVGSDHHALRLADLGMV